MSDENFKNAINYYKDFYPNSSINEYCFNDIGTHLDYSFFFKIWSNENINEHEDIGTIYYEHIVYEDND